MINKCLKFQEAILIHIWLRAEWLNLLKHGLFMAISVNVDFRGTLFKKNYTWFKTKRGNSKPIMSGFTKCQVLKKLVSIFAENESCFFWPKEGKKVSIFCITILFNSHPCFTSSILCLENKMSTAMSLNLHRVQDGTWGLKINILLIIIQQLKYFLSHYPIFSSNRLVPFSKFLKL